jgi:hypothetical protein
MPPHTHTHTHRHTHTHSQTRRPRKPLPRPPYRRASLTIMTSLPSAPAPAPTSGATCATWPQPSRRLKECVCPECAKGAHHLSPKSPIELDYTALQRMRRFEERRALTNDVVSHIWANDRLSRCELFLLLWAFVLREGFHWKETPTEATARERLNI